MPFHLADQSLGLIFVIFAICTLVIGVAGTRLAGIAVKLAERTGIGQIIAGALFVGMSTSLPGSVLSVTTAWQGQCNGFGPDHLACQYAFRTDTGLCRAGMDDLSHSPSFHPVVCDLRVWSKLTVGNSR